METTADEVVTKVNETMAVPPTGGPTGEVLEETFVEKVVLWRDLKLSGAIFGAVNLICILTLFLKYSFLSVFSFLVMALLVASFLFKNAAKLLEGHLGKDNIPQPSFGLEPFQAEAIQAKVPQIVDFLNENITKIRDVVTCKDNKTTLKALGATFGVYLVGRIFPDLVLFYLLFLAAFILPKVYELNKDEIDKAAAQAQARIAEVGLDPHRSSLKIPGSY
uniref:Reticulon-like protein n=1 Tax=Rhodosorus marinus TaxID=101924 RepID=A0A7S2ZRI1_9RHOD|mmetsp:Transcript_30054/g.115376  ORF Transcript_30054/g.115376 Transcript_30054/m.115376 type:complete len:220 (+) Transcript_30054:133-792(+)